MLSLSLRNAAFYLASLLLLHSAPLLLTLLLPQEFFQVKLVCIGVFLCVLLVYLLLWCIVCTFTYLIAAVPPKRTAGSVTLLYGVLFA